MYRFCYPVTLTRDREAGGYVVTFKDVPEAITQGDNMADALSQAQDCLEEAIAGRIRLGKDIPASSKAAKDQHIVTLPVATAAKAALYIAIRESGLSKIELAARLGIDEKEVRRLLDPYYPSKVPRIESALEGLGKKLVVIMRDADDPRQAELTPAHA